MKTSYLIPLIIVVILAIAGFLLSQKSNPQNNSIASTTVVLMKEDLFEPETITIKKGAIITFKNEDKVARWPASNLHPTHGIYPEFDPQKPIEPNDSWSFTFNQAGSWKYHDHLIPSIRGIVVVTE